MTLVLVPVEAMVAIVVSVTVQVPNFTPSVKVNTEPTHTVVPPVMAVISGVGSIVSDTVATDVPQLLVIE